MATRRPLPLPPFRSLTSLSAPELLDVCVRFHGTTLNLSSPLPQVRTHRRLVMRAQTSPVAHLGFLPGGQHMIVLHLNGMMQVWDCQSDAVISSDTAVPGAVGRLLASYDTGLPPETLNFQTTGEDETTVMIVVISKTPWVVFAHDLCHRTEGKLLWLTGNLATQFAYFPSASSPRS